MDIIINNDTPQTAVPQPGQVVKPLGPVADKKTNYYIIGGAILVVIVLIYFVYVQFSTKSTKSKEKEELKRANEELIEELNTIMLEPENGSKNK